MIKGFEMEQSDLDALMNAFKSAPLVAINCGEAMSQQERANNAWKNLGDKMGFNHMTVKPNGSDPKRFYAEVKCKGIEIGDGNFSGCDQSAGDCPTCGK